ncbi:hypothetical protein [Wansuia hejianensis]|uniref:Uncharacterized protein n=1 Tax=Wansuia hejianensis TaxID=2763667 RepID=A0A926EY46_9FIRM|nr:hypothetical protein [Wansuia hejianensis]MBC8589697.1 hypothetical protein [Wansuia hejianensis]
MLNEKFLINLQGKNYVTYEGLLDLAHQKGLLSIEVDIIQIPNKENNMTAICKAIATTEKETYIDIGDASPNSVNHALVPHIIRMASTRAKARALRDLTNVGMTAIEELSLEENIMEDEEVYQGDLPTKRQIETIKKLAEELNYQVNYDNLTKKTAGNLIAKLLDDKKSKP